MSSLRAKRKTRAKIRRMAVPSAVVNRSNSHIYVQICSPEGRILGAVSSLTPAIRKKHPNGGNKATARFVGHEAAKLAQKLGYKKLAFDRSGFLYHGRIKEVAEGLREGGIEV